MYFVSQHNLVSFFLLTKADWREFFQQKHSNFLTHLYPFLSTRLPHPPPLKVTGCSFLSIQTDEVAFDKTKKTKLQRRIAIKKAVGTIPHQSLGTKKRGGGSSLLPPPFIAIGAGAEENDVGVGGGGGVVETDHLNQLDDLSPTFFETSSKKEQLSLSMKVKQRMDAE